MEAETVYPEELLAADSLNAAGLVAGYRVRVGRDHRRDVREQRGLVADLLQALALDDDRRRLLVVHIVSKTCLAAAVLIVPSSTRRDQLAEGRGRHRRVRRWRRPRP